MKKAGFLVLALSLSGLFIISCDGWEQPVTGTLIKNSDCKSSKSVYLDDYTPDSLSCVSYIYDAYTKKLSLTHVNAGFNCCPGKISCRISLDGETLIIKERERVSLCNCDCLFDLEIEVEGLEAKLYQVKFEEPYCGEQPQLIFDADLENCPEGSFCVTRKMYPWGMQSQE